MSSETKHSAVSEIINNKQLKIKVDEAFKKEESYEWIIGLCKQYGVDVSKSTLTRYKKKVEEAKETGVPLENIADKRQASSIENKEVASFGDVKPLISSVQALDDFIQKGYEGMQASNGYPSPKDYLKAIELYAKITDNRDKGLTIQGLKELKLRQEAKIQALTQAVAKYIPVEKQEDVIKDLEKSEKEFYDSLNMSDAQRKITKELREVGIDE